MKIGPIKIYFDEPEVRYFTNFLKEFFKDKYLCGVEVGVQYGDNAKSMLDNLNIEKLYLIDPYLKYKDYDDSKWVREYTQKDFDNLYEQAKLKFKKYDNVKFIREKSLDACKQFEDFTFDSIYVDGNHKQIYQDLCAWYPKVKMGGVIGGHDFCSHHPSVARGFFKFCDENNIIFNPETDKNGLTHSGYGYEWWIIKSK